jgi:hypothetical protein
MMQKLFERQLSNQKTEAPVQDRLWRASHGYRFLVWRRRIAWVKRVWKDVKQVVEWLEVIVVVLASVVLILFLLFGIGNPLP